LLSPRFLRRPSIRPTLVSFIYAIKSLEKSPPPPPPKDNNKPKSQKSKQKKKIFLFQKIYLMQFHKRRKIEKEMEDIISNERDSPI
jgi:hypothetical protein